MYTQKQIDSAINALVRSYNSKAIKEKAHETLVAITEFCNMHSDGSNLDKLFGALPNTANKRGMRIWLQAYTGWDIRKAKDKKEKFLSRDKDNKTAFFFIVEGKDNPFYAMDEVNADSKKNPKPFNIIAAIEDLLKRGNSQVESGKIKDERQIFLIRELSKAMPKRLVELSERANTFVKNPEPTGEVPFAPEVPAAPLRAVN